jgi:hypothetical protein
MTLQGQAECAPVTELRTRRVSTKGARRDGSYGLEDASALVLVRPDGYIGYFGKPGSCARLENYLSKVLLKAEAEPLRHEVRGSPHGIAAHRCACVP